MNTRTYLPAALAALTAIVLPELSWAANEVGFIERFALAGDREKALAELVPGSEDYYFFHALHYQNTRNAAKLADILAQWRKRSPDENARRRMIENREALLDYEATPQKTLAYLKERLGVTFNHQRVVRDQKPELPTALDPKNIAREVFERDALANDGGLESFSQGALEQLVRNKVKLTDQQRRALLNKLNRPDVPGLVELIIAELKSEDSPGFGGLAVSEHLLPEQLDALAKAVPALATEDEFIDVKLKKLAPSADADAEFDPAEREAWLERLWAYAKTLPASCNSIKGAILYRRLDHDRKKGVYDAARFLEYLKLPREVEYANPKWLDKTREEHRVDLSTELEIFSGEGAIGKDEPLVREYFLALFDKAAAAAPGKAGEGLLAPYKEYVQTTWLRPILAEALIVGGYGNPERWASWLTPTEFQALKDRVDLEFPKTNAAFLETGGDVQFDVIVKNSPKVIVKIYEVNTLNFFLTQKRQLNTDLNLDGLVANSEQTHTFETGPFKRTRETFKFPELKGKRGAWVVEFIGGGRSSRALIRTAPWQVLQQTGPTGDLLLVLDEKGQPVKDAVAWLDGRKFTMDEKLGRIVVPYSAEPGEREVVVSDSEGKAATLASFEQHSEEYRFEAQFYIEREQLLARREATLAVRTDLMLGESHLDPSIVSEPRLTITTTTLDGVSTTREVKDLKLSAGSVLLQSIPVPERLATLEVTLSGKVAMASKGGEKRDVSASHTWQLNGIDRTEVTNDGHFSKFEGAYVFEVLGKNGEPVADQPILFTFKHRGFSRTQQVSLRTDEKGRIALGTLTGMETVNGALPNGRQIHFAPVEAERTWEQEIHAKVGDVVRIPWPATLPSVAGETPQAELSLLEVRSDTPVADWKSKLALKNGFVEIAGLAPGDYALSFRDNDLVLEIRVTDGQAMGGWLLGKHRNLQLPREATVHATGVTVEKEVVAIKLANATPFTRVHIAATRFEPGAGIFSGLAQFTRFGLSEGAPAKQPNLYSAGREIGDEYRYILERRYAKLFPGNMLARPGLLLNPWAIRDTSTEALAQQGGQDASKTEGGKEAKSAADLAPISPEPSPSNPEAAAASNLDFLADAAPTLYNLLPDKDGVVRIDRKVLGDRQHVQIYVEDLGSAEWQSFALSETATKLADQRLVRNLDPAKPFSQRREYTVLEQGRTMTLADVLSSEVETYDTLGGIHSLLSTLSHDGTFAQFAWVLQWPKMKDDEKRAKYSEFACHELNFFLAHKDPDFFAKVIKPALANKKDKTFLDDFLLGNDLAGYLEPWAYARLNALERALLGQRVPAEAANVARQLREQWELQPPNPTEEERLFETALRGRMLEENEFGESTGKLIKGLKGKADTAAAEHFYDAPAAPAEKTAVAAPKPPPAPMGNLSSAAGLSAADAKDYYRQSTNRYAFSAQQMDKLAEVDEKLGEITMREEAPVKQELKQLGANARERQMALGRSVNGLRGWAEDDAIRGPDANFAYFGRGDVVALQQQARSYYRALGVTKEWAENNYYHLRIAQQDASLIPVNAFWRDYAQWVADGAKGAFVSPHIGEAHRNFAEMMLALAVTDLPFDAPKHTNKVEGGQLQLTAGGPVIVFHKEVKPSAGPAADAPQGQLLVSQSFFRDGDRYRQEGNEKFEKYVTSEFLTGTVYGANVVVTNPTSAPAKADVLLQIPKGALPVKGSKPTDSRFVRLAPYSTQTFEYFFYFPKTGEKKFPHFPVNVAVNGSVVGAAKPFEFQVVTKLSEIDKASWDYLSQEGTAAEVFTFLEQNNLRSVDLERIAWRCKDAAFFKKLTGFLLEHHIWNETIYSYALLHNDPAALREWLLRKDDFASQCGPWLSSKLILLDPVARRTYEHLEYSPLVNQRAHRVGAEHRIANPAVLGQYRSLLDVLAYKPALDATDNMGVTYYLFLQDRVEEALTRFHSIEAKELPTQIQHDYFRCYADLYESNLADARGVAARYADYPVPRWRTLFAGVTSQLDEIEGVAKPGKGEDNRPDRERQQAELAASEPSFDFKVENRTIALNYKNLTEVTVNYYLMDPEFSFSSSPFVSEDSSRFSIVKPTKSETMALAKDKDKVEVALPAEFAKANVLVELVAAGQRKAQAYHANTLKLTVTENYGRLETRDAGNDKPVAKAYVKVYARLKNGTVRFFKDGYTDLRGRFDYASLNGPTETVDLPQEAVARASNAPSGLNYQMLKPAELAQVDKMAILILSEGNGAMTREVNPPKQ